MIKTQKFLAINSAQGACSVAVGEPNEISDAVQWLLSDQSSYVTGHTLMIDGGFCAQ